MMNELVVRKEAEVLILPVIQEGLLYIKDGLKKAYPELAEKFPKVLPYHNVAHAKDVLHEALLFALTDGTLSGHELELLAITAVYHDSGVVGGYAGHEARSAKIVGEFMKRHGYSETDIVRVQTAILAGPNKELRSKEPISTYLIDADLSNFGRKDFFDKSKAWFKELVLTGDEEDTAQSFRVFRKRSYEWISKIMWNTSSARQLRQAQYEVNMKALKQELEKGA